MTEQREDVAAAIYYETCKRNKYLTLTSWENQSEDLKKYFRWYADAAMNVMKTPNAHKEKYNNEWANDFD